MVETRLNRNNNCCESSPLPVTLRVYLSPALLYAFVSLLILLNINLIFFYSHELKSCTLSSLKTTNYYYYVIVSFSAKNPFTRSDLRPNLWNDEEEEKIEVMRIYANLGTEDSPYY